VSAAASTAERDEEPCTRMTASQPSSGLSFTSSTFHSRRGARDRLSLQPVLCLQLGYPPEVMFVAGHYPQPTREGDRRDAHIGVADRSAQPLQIRPDLTVAPGSRGVESEYGQIEASKRPTSFP
jgi:hypothetical protein